MRQEDIFKDLERLIDRAFSKLFSKKKEKKTVKPETQPKAAHEETAPNFVFESIEDYTTKTGKRFRMLKDQKERGLSREEAFKETFGGLN